MDRALRHTSLTSLRSLAWILVIVGGSLAFSFGFACATPFAALAAVGGMQLRRLEAFGAVLLAWIGNQAIGFLVLHYPQTWDCFAWGGAIGVAALVAVFLATSVTVLTKRTVARILVGFAAAFVGYEGVLSIAGFVLPNGGGAFAPWIVVRILEVNALAYLGLLILHRLAVEIGVLSSPIATAPVVART